MGTFSLSRRNGGGVGPVRTKGRGGAAGVRGGRKALAKPKTADDLDKELEAFMHDDIVPAQPSAKKAAPAVEGDVEMV